MKFINKRVVYALGTYIQLFRKINNSSTKATTKRIKQFAHILHILFANYLNSNTSMILDRYKGRNDF